MEKGKLSEVLAFRVSTEDAMRIYGWAKQSDMGVADYLRRVSVQGITFTIQMHKPETLIVESTTLETVEEMHGELDKRKNGPG